MPLSHLMLAFLVAIIWGINFLFVKIALDEISPILLCALRFLLASIPLVFFLKPPAVPFRLVIWYGLIMFVLQFLFFFIGMHSGMIPGMASLIMQVQIFFSMFFASLFLNEKPTTHQILGALVSFCGIGLVGFHFDNDISATGFILILASAAAWGFGNLITKKTKNINMMALVVWGSFVACFPLLLMTLLFEGTQSIVQSYNHITWKGLLAVFYIVYASTWVGYGVWNWLLSRHAVAVIVPFTLLVPVVGILSSVMFLGEPFQEWKLISCLLVITGLCINILGARFYPIKVAQEAAN
jgi:O-acetylserine/cysteine efflux transporter